MRYARGNASSNVLELRWGNVKGRNAHSRCTDSIMRRIFSRRHCNSCKRTERCQQCTSMQAEYAVHLCTAVAAAHLRHHHHHHSKWQRRRHIVNPHRCSAPQQRLQLQLRQGHSHRVHLPQHPPSACPSHSSSTNTEHSATTSSSRVSPRILLNSSRA